jgi:hypothetical protein
MPSPSFVNLRNDSTRELAVDLDEAVGNFHRATRHCENLIAVHRGHGGPGRGRRDEEISINRAVVVLAVASWQAVVQDLALACIDSSAPGPESPLSPKSYAILAGRVRNEIGDFSTPNAQNTRRLLQAAGYDPRPSWTWTQRGGRARGMVTWTPADADRRLDEWLKIRHALAHGHESLPQVDALQAVRGIRNPPTDPVLRLVDAEECLAFFRRLTRLTTAGIASHLEVTPSRLP